MRCTTKLLLKKEKEKNLETVLIVQVKIKTEDCFKRKNKTTVLSIDVIRKRKEIFK